MSFQDLYELSGLEIPYIYLVILTSTDNNLSISLAIGSDCPTKYRVETVRLVSVTRIRLDAS
jgi:hypothetical protein